MNTQGKTVESHVYRLRILAAILLVVSSSVRGLNRRQPKPPSSPPCNRGGMVTRLPTLIKPSPRQRAVIEAHRDDWP